MKHGHLDVGNGHRIYFENWGNLNASPILYLHGGPGGNFSDSNKLLFNPDKHRVIFHDQRGARKSTPYAETTHNTTQDLIADIDRLADHLKIDTFSLVGGSWGSTLSLLYAIVHPERVNRLVLWGIFLARQWESDYVNEGYPKHTFPEAWDRFISLVPPRNRTHGDAIMEYYAQTIRSKNKNTAKKYADEWSLWESTLLSIDYDQRTREAEVLSENNLAGAMLETHYFLNKCFIPENYILDNIHTIQHIPCSVVQGRFDLCTPPINAFDLAKAYGEKLTLQWTNAGHQRTDPENFTALRAIFNSIS